MNFERSRLRTFQNWPVNAPIDYERIAKAGFYYVGQNLEVQCFSCGGQISEWQYGDMVMAKHRLLDPRCPFVVNPVESGNVPITSTSNETVIGGTSGFLNDRPIESALNDRCKYKCESVRLETFVTWPIPSKVEGFRLAKAGFYYLQEMDKVRCAFCGIDAYNWEAGDDPIVEHRRHSPMCPFLSNLSVGCSSQNSDNVLTLRDEYFDFESQLGLSASQMKDFGILNHRIPKHSKYMTEESRLSSFERWPKPEVTDPIVLAAAGFYYTGVEDKVRCYHCGGGLQKWKANDDPWIEHVKWFSTCDFIYLVKGEGFINEVKEKFKAQEESGNSQDSIIGSGRSSMSHVIDDNILQVLMTSAPVLSTLDLGLDVSRVKRVLRDRLERQRNVFTSGDELIAAVLDAQFNEPVADLTEESWIDESDMEFRELRRESSRFLSGSSHSLVQNLQSTNEDLLGLISEEETEENHVIMAGEFLNDSPNLPEEFDETDHNSELGNGSSFSNVENRLFKNESFTTPRSCIENTQNLEEENRRLRETKLCKICMDQDVNIVFLPCGHLVTCSNCAANIPDCPICRQMIKGTVRTFLA